jgi:TonB-linked SusC/RagA family outer membrane protein
VIVDSKGAPVIGAGVKVKDSNEGAVTDVDGHFDISNVRQGTILEISCMGYKSQEVVWNGKELNIVLEEDTQYLDEVVVVGYGTQKKVNVTGAVSMVNSDVIEDRPVSNAVQALQGNIPGLNLTVNSNGGMLNNTMTIRVRGTGSIGNGSNDAPLILIDGIEGDINQLNPNDIESVSVLKDAASAAIYGTRAAFGVILVTTKSGKEGKVKINYTGDVRFSTATQLPNMVNSWDFANYFNVASINSGAGAVFSEETLERIQKFRNGEYTDPTQPEYYGTVANAQGTWWQSYSGAFADTNWFDEFYKKNVPSTQHNLSVSGGNDRVNYMVSGGFLMNNGLIRHGHDQLNRFNLSAKINVKLASWARMEYNTKWSRQLYEKPQYLSGLFFHNIARRWPTNPVKDPNGHWMAGMEIEELENGGTRNTKDDIFSQQLNFTLTPIEGWTIHADGAFKTDYYKSKTNKFPVYSYQVDNTPVLRNSDYGLVTSVDDYRYKSDYYSVNIYTDYTRSFGLHNFTALLGLNYEKFKNDHVEAYGENLTSQDYPYLSQTQDNPWVGDAYWHRATAGYFGRLNYDYDSKYLFQFTIRYDGSSRFTSDKRWDWFPSVSVGWNVAREDFFKQLTDKISELKFRATYGTLGNTNSYYSSFSDWYPFYQQQSLSSSSSSWLIGGEQQNTASMPSIVNSSMTWETVESYNLGLDFDAFNDRLTGSFDWYVRKTKDMIGPAPVLGSVLGVDAPKTNNCDMKSTGWEFEVQWRDHIGKVNYYIKGNISDATSKILRYPYEGDFDNQSIYSYYNGKVLGEIWGYTTEGIANSQEEMDAWLENNKPNWGSSWGAGDVMFKNIVDRYDSDGNVIDEGVVNSGSGTIGDHGDLKRIGNSTPRYNFGFTIGADWKGIDFSIFFQGVGKRDWWPGSGEAYFWGAQGNMWQSTCFKEHLDYWSEDNTDAYYPKPYLANGITKNQVSQTRYLQNAAYMRCKNLQVGYSLPNSVLQYIGASRCRIYFSCDNVFTITELSSVFDPEALNGSWGDGKLYPLQRTWSLGVNLTF